MRAFGLIGLLIVLGVGAYVYKQQIQGVSGPGGSAANPRATIDVVGVRNDLIALASAERRYFASNGKYVSLDELISNGDVSMKTPTRGPYQYSSELVDDGFRIVATYNGPPDAAVPKMLAIDTTMQISTE